ncbi:hypothetical protein Gotur_034179 [Gossypium turneri]
MVLGVEVGEMGWDLSLRAQTRRALAMNSVWLREEEEDWGGNKEEMQRSFILLLAGNGGPRIKERRTSTSVYFDTAFDQQHARSASVLSVRGEGGEILASKSVIHTNIATPFAAKAHAGLQALELGKSIGTENIYAHLVATEALKKGEGHYLAGAILITVRRAAERVSPRYQD